jgi:hypothetical protein
MVRRRVTEDSVLAVQIFDQKKFKKKDQGFLGVINVRIGSVIDLDAGGDGTNYPKPDLKHTLMCSIQRCSRAISRSPTITW